MNQSEEKTEKLSLFDHLNNLTKYKIMLDDSDPEVMKTFDPYIVNRFVSMEQVFLLLCNELNKNQQFLSKMDFYKVLFYTLPKRTHYFNYIKKPKELNKKEKECLSRYYGFGSKDLELAINVLDETQIEEIVNKYKVGKK